MIITERRKTWKLNELIKMREINTVNRGKLRRDIEKGLYEGKLGFSISRDGEYPDKFGYKEKWLPVRVSKGFNDFVNNQINLHEYSFKAKTGLAYKEKDIIHFSGHSNELFYLRKKKK